MLGNYELAATSTSSSSGFPTSTLFIILIIVLAFWMFFIRPQQRRRQQAQQQNNNIQPGARVRTIGGMYATVVAVDGDDVILEVAPGVESRYMKRAIAEVVSPAETTDDPAEAEDEDYAGDITDEAAEADDADAEETVYEQATGTKQD